MLTVNTKVWNQFITVEMPSGKTIQAQAVHSVGIRLKTDTVCQQNVNGNLLPVEEVKRSMISTFMQEAIRLMMWHGIQEIAETKHIK